MTHFSKPDCNWPWGPEFEDVLDDAQLLNAGRLLYDRWAGDLARKRQWQQATDVYANALERFTHDPHLVNNAAATWNSWATEYIEAKEWAEAIDVYDQALRAFPDNATFKNNRTYCQQKLDRGSG